MTLTSYNKSHQKLDLTKLTRNPKLEPIDLDSYPNRHPKWAEPIWTRKPDVNRSIIERNPKLIHTRNDPAQVIPDP